jgi:hypothetical protein
VDRPLAEGPRALLEVGLLHELDQAAAVDADPVLVVRALGAEVLGAHAAAQELVHRPRLADRGGGAVGASDRVLERHVAAVPGLAVVLLGLADDAVRDAAGMREVEALGSEALALLDRDSGRAQAVRPVADRVGGDGDPDGPELVGPAPAHPSRLAVRERRLPHLHRPRAAVRLNRSDAVALRRPLALLAGVAREAPHEL